METSNLQSHSHLIEFKMNIAPIRSIRPFMIQRKLQFSIEDRM